MLKNLKKKTIGVLMGGISAERKVSIKTGAAVAKALRELGYNIKEVDVTFQSIKTLSKLHIDVAFIALHGRFGEDGTIQGMLELLRIPYTGSSLTASVLAINKLLTKQVLMFNKIKTPPFTAINIDEYNDLKVSLFFDELPVIVKPINEGSSIGVSIVKKKEELKGALDKAFAYDNTILVEDYIKAREIQVGILNNKALGVIEIIPKNEFYDYDAKYSANKAEHIFPADLPKKVYKKAMNIGLNVYKALGCSGAARVDLLLDKDHEIYTLEVNTLPGMTDVSLMPEIAKGVGISFPTLCEKILKGAMLHVKDGNK